MNRIQEFIIFGLIAFVIFVFVSDAFIYDPLEARIEAIENHFECVRACYDDGVCVNFDENFVSMHAFVGEKAKCVLWQSSLSEDSDKR